MSTSLSDLRRWFESGKKSNKAFLIVVCDTFDHEDYPVYCCDAQHCLDQYDNHNGKNMQRVMEVYDLSKPWEDVSARKLELPTRPVDKTSNERSSPK